MTTSKSKYRLTLWDRIVLRYHDICPKHFVIRGGWYCYLCVRDERRADERRDHEEEMKARECAARLEAKVTGMRRGQI